jgi:hypothetical protein
VLVQGAYVQLIGPPVRVSAGFGAMRDGAFRPFLLFLSLWSGSACCHGEFFFHDFVPRFSSLHEFKNDNNFIR